MDPHSLPNYNAFYPTTEEVNRMICDLEHNSNPTPADKEALNDLRKIQNQTPDNQNGSSFYDEILNNYKLACSMMSDLEIKSHARSKADKLSLLYYRYEKARNELELRRLGHNPEQLFFWTVLVLLWKSPVESTGLFCYIKIAWKNFTKNNYIMYNFYYI